MLQHSFWVRMFRTKEFICWPCDTLIYISVFLCLNSTSVMLNFASLEWSRLDGRGNMGCELSSSGWSIPHLKIEGGYHNLWRQCPDDWNIQWTSEGSLGSWRHKQEISFLLYMPFCRALVGEIIFPEILFPSSEVLIILNVNFGNYKLTTFLSATNFILGCSAFVQFSKCLTH